MFKGERLSAPDVSALPENYIVLGRDWDNRVGKRPKLSMEARMTVDAIGQIAKSRRVDSIIFSGGLLAENGVSEAKAMHRYLNRHFKPDELQVDGAIYEEARCFDTVTSAEHSAQVIEAQSLEGPFGLVGSRSHMKRATEIFGRQGLDVVPVVAEPLFAQRSAHHAAFAERHRGSLRDLRWRTQEGLLNMPRVGGWLQKLARRYRAGKFND
ncbi:MAG TPA: YdcF family protein [Candidatus Saccharimonadales bacterium]|nr:YdcF family protein [Candidatus Saccharimonadales bacterium]